jgi:hypothetical protein
LRGGRRTGAASSASSGNRGASPQEDKKKKLNPLEKELEPQVTKLVDRNRKKMTSV